MNTYETPKKQKFNIENVKHISVSDAYDAVLANKVYFLDIREEDETNIEFFDFRNLFMFPMSEIMDKLEHLPRNISIVVACSSGTRGTKVANMLIRQGYNDVANLDGGIIEWKANNFPTIETGIKPEDTSCCDISDCEGNCSGCC
ncbi:rhodanese-like domain-containing protein [Bacteroidales bacterium OttesenSCG-928-I21]|nr:rhodanese-like domain-containing protein [Bacteroidales bacterium OttesenSCG-928-I21]